MNRTSLARKNPMVPLAEADRAKTSIAAPNANPVAGDTAGLQKSRWWRGGLLRASGIVSLLSAWAILTYGGFVGGNYLPTPTAFVDEFILLSTDGFHGTPLHTHVIASLERALMGFGLAVITGVPVGLIVGYYETPNKLLSPVFSFFRPIPPIAFIPLAVVYLGIGQASKVALIYYAAFLFIVLSTQSGVRTVPNLLLRSGRNIGLTQGQLFRRVILPGSMPHILTGVRTSLSISWALVVAAELVAAQSGLGYMIMDAGIFFQLTTVYVGIFVVGVIGILMDAVVLYLQHRLLHWQGE